MDRFKFRIWDIKTKAMRNVWAITPFGVVVNDLKTENYKIPLNDSIIMQCTGLKDKNGKLIYEGDVVTYEWLTPLGKVWRNDGKYIVEWSDGFCLLSNITRYGVEHGIKRNVEIIGNIYENPELSEKGNVDV